jgi:hypothetical protein
MVSLLVFSSTGFIAINCIMRHSNIQKNKKLSRDYFMEI